MPARSKILLVDDEPEAIQALRAALSQTNSHEIRTATGREAAQSAQAREAYERMKRDFDFNPRAAWP